MPPLLAVIAATLVFYITISLVTHHVSARFHPETKLNPERGFSKLPWLKVATLFVVNTSLVGLLIGLAIDWSADGITHLRWVQPDSFATWTQVVLQFLLILLLCDMNFYWVHRAAHSHPWLMRHFHRDHHEAKHPNVWHCQYQHPLDYLATTALPMLWIPMLPLPWSYEAYLAALVFCHFTNIGGHSGFEVTSMPIARLSLNGLAMWIDPHRRHIARIFNTVCHHDLHHQRANRNFSLYFTFWDTWCGTASHAPGLEIVPVALHPETTVMVTPSEAS